MRFHALLKPDFDKDFELNLRFSERNTPDTLILLEHIQWMECDTDSTEISFNLFQSPDSKKLTSFMEKLKIEQQENVCPT